jgi:hypothetical protein
MLSKIPAKRPGIIATLILLSVAVAGAVAQKAQAPGTHITVCKSTGEDACSYKTIQEAVNAAKPGQVIEILDEAVYEEQVTIDGRDVSPWDGKNGGPVKAVKGGKNRITIRYVPGTDRPLGNHARPTVKWKDVTNHSPLNTAEGNVDGDTPGTSGNFETCGALRIIRAQGVTIDGIKVDGGGAAPFGTDGVWGTTMFHGNAAVAIVVAGGAVIRNCDLTNAYYGIAIKDRNTGGVFGNPNPADNDLTVPLSGFGKTGNHLIEYNKIHDHMTGIFAESAWDLATTVRYNLIYNNIHKASLLTGIPGSIIAEGGAILFRDVLLTPFAIYNNTFFNNTRNLMGGWKAGVSHLVFNNIFSGDSTIRNGKAHSMTIEDKLPYRMHNSVFAATGTLNYEEQYVGECRKDGNYSVTPPVPEIFGQNIPGFSQVDVHPLATPTTGSTQVRCLPPINDKVVTTNKFIPPGALLTNAVFGASANLRWLETAKSIEGTEDLFVSTNPASADFLRPKWNHPLVVQFIKAQGWAAIGMKNSDGSVADIGAISSTGHVPSVLARIKPVSVVLASGTTANASFRLAVDGGEINDAKIGFLRWVMPLPASEKTVVPKNSIMDITPPATAVNVNGGNQYMFNIPALPARPANDTIGQYGFFEVTVSGKDKNGNPVTSDIGFLPYRRLDYKLKIEVLAANGSGADLATVQAGQPYTLKVTPVGSDGAPVSYALNEVSYDLLSSPASFMRTVSGDAELASDRNLPAAGKTYQVYFSHAGEETITGAGVYSSSGAGVAFFGTKDLVVTPGVPAKAVFINPVSSSQLGDAPANVVNRGRDYSVEVEVQDRFGNAVNAPVAVTIVSDKPNIGDAGAPGNIAAKTVNCGTDGVAVFTARTGNGAVQNGVFEMTASIAGGASDKGKLRVGRSLDRLEIFYSDNNPNSNRWQDYYDPSVIIDGKVYEWHEVTVKVVASDMVNALRTNQYVHVNTYEKLMFSATSGGMPAEVFPLTNGVATFWVSANRDVSGACVDVYALNSNSADDIDGSINPGGRCGINFVMPSRLISHAVVYGDGHGRPDSLLICYVEGGASLSNAGVKPDKVTLTWPAAGGVVMEAEGSALSVRGDYVLHVDLRGIANRLAGYTSMAGAGRRLVSVYGVGGDPTAVEEFFDVYDGIGPVLSDGGDAGGRPLIMENFTGVADTLLIKVSESLRNSDMLLGNTLFYTTEANPVVYPATGGTPLTVLSAWLVNGGANFYAYRIAVAHVDGLQDGAWIRFNPESGVTDRAAVPGITEDNKPHAGNRWVQLLQVGFISVASPAREVPPVKPAEEVVTLVPVSRLAVGLTAGPSPAGKNSGVVNFFRGGSRVMPSALYVYDASGNVVRKIAVGDNAVGTGIGGRRVVGSWDLTDAKGRAVPEGAYLVRGVVKTAGGKSEKVSVVVGVR